MRPRNARWCAVCSMDNTLFGGARGEVWIRPGQDPTQRVLLRLAVPDHGKPPRPASAERHGGRPGSAARDDSNTDAAQKESQSCSRRCSRSGRRAAVADRRVRARRRESPERRAARHRPPARCGERAVRRQGQPVQRLDRRPPRAAPAPAVRARLRPRALRRCCRGAGVSQPGFYSAARAAAAHLAQALHSRRAHVAPCNSTRSHCVQAIVHDARISSCFLTGSTATCAPIVVLMRAATVVLLAPRGRTSRIHREEACGVQVQRDYVGQQGPRRRTACPQQAVRGRARVRAPLRTAQ